MQTIMICVSLCQVFLDYMMFLKRLSTEANVTAQEQKENTLSADHINSALKDVLKGMRG